MTTPTTTPRRIKIRNLPPVLPCLPVMDSPPQGDKVVVLSCQRMTYDEYLVSEVWQIKRKEIIERDGGKCRLCNSEKILHVHHRNYPKCYGEEPNEDLITLCRKCHYIFHNNRSTHQIAKKTKKIKNNPNFRTNGKPSISRLQRQLERILQENGLLPIDCTVKFKDAIKIICLKTNQQFPKGDKYKQVQIANAYIKGEGVIQNFKKLTYA